MNENEDKIVEETEPEDEVIEIKLEVCLTASDIDDIMCTAFEGGINYWCDRAEVVGDYLGEYASDQISRGGEVRLYDSESTDVYTLTRAKFIEGFKKFIADGRSDLIDHGMIDLGMLDASDADVIVQYALFGEVVYG